MKVLMNKSFVQKIAIILIFFILFNFSYVTIVHAEESIEEQNEKISGGILLSPVLSLVTSIADGAVTIAQRTVLGMETSFFHVNNGEEGVGIFGTVAGVLAGGAIIVGSVAAVVGTGGATLPVVLSGLAAGSKALAGAAISGVVVKGGLDTITKSMIPDDFYLPNFKLSPEEIFSNKVPALDVNFISPNKYVDSEGNAATNSDGEQYVSIASELRDNIAKWYVALRNMVLVGLMVVLLYVGIRIVISSTAQEKAKYKENIKDWIIALVIVIFMHYIMAFALTITEQITNMLNGVNSTVIVPLPEMATENAEIEIPSENGITYWGTNLMGQARILQQLQIDESGNGLITFDRIGYTIIYVVLVIYMIMFLIIYFKRVVYMTFLTLMAPVVALTYPIDKLSDGKAQAFDMWLKEYIYNLLIQPFHLLIYTVSVGTAMELASENMIYALVAIGFLLPAEKLLRKFFGFEKASTMGSIMGGALGGAVVMQGINALRGLGSGKKSSGGNGKGENAGNDDGKLNLTPEKSVDELYANALGAGSADGAVPGNAGTAGYSKETGYSNDLYDIMQQAQSGTGEDDGIGDSDDPYAIMQQAQLGQASATPTNNPGGATQGANRGANSGRTVQVNSPRRNPSTNNRKKKLISPKVAAGLKTGLKYTGKALPKVSKAALKLTTGAALGTIGVAAGLASDDYTNVLKYGAAGAGAGYIATGGAINAFENITGSAGSGAKNLVENIQDDYLKEQYGDGTKEYKKAVRNLQIDRWMKDRENIQTFKNKFGNDYEQRMEQAKDYIEYGVTDAKLITKAMLHNQLRGDEVSQERIAAARAAQTVKNGGDIDALNDRLGRNGVSEDQIRRFNRVINDMTDN